MNGVGCWSCLSYFGSAPCQSSLEYIRWPPGSVVLGFGSGSVNNAGLSQILNWLKCTAANYEGTYTIINHPSRYIMLIIRIFSTVCAVGGYD